jgi:hypothetical protein
VPSPSPLRLPSRAPVIWRDPSSLQIGVEHVHAVVDRVTTGQAAFLAAVSAGRGDGGVAAVVAQVGCDPAEAAELVGALGSVVLADAAAELDPRRRPVVRLAGTGPLVDEVGRLLESASLGVVLEDRESAAAAPGPRPAADRRGRAGETSSSSTSTSPRARRAARRPRSAREGVHVGVLVGGLVPDPVVSAEWLRRDVPHLVVRVGDRSVRVGPVVVPGVTACARCLHLHDGDRDSAWPALAGQLVTLPVPPPPLLVARDAAVRTARRALQLARSAEAAWASETTVAGDGDSSSSSREGDPDPDVPQPGEVVRIDLESLEVSSSVVRPHPDCGCGAPPGTGSAGARRPGPARSAPTRGAGAPGPG